MTCGVVSGGGIVGYFPDFSGGFIGIRNVSIKRSKPSLEIDYIFSWTDTLISCNLFRELKTSHEKCSLIKDKNYHG